MAGVLPDSVFGVLLQNVIDFLKYNKELLGDAEENFNKLRLEFGILEGYLQQCTENYSSSRLLDNVANRVRNLVHRAEDAIETFIVEAAKHKLKGKFEQWFNQVEYKNQVRNLALEIEKICADVKEFYQNEAHLGIEALKLKKHADAEKPAVNLKPPVEDTVVGLQDETAKVIDLLLKGEEELDVISIFGMYGLGKTTLAKKVFNDPRIDYHSFVRAFVEVSRDVKTKEVFLKIINSFTTVTEDNRNMSEEELAKFIKASLENRNYLIVLDDIWDKAAWDKLKCAFPINNKRSRVLITTREIEVAEQARRKSDPHCLRFLYEYEARELLRLKVFDENRCPVDLEELEIRILKKCDGLPLAIVVIAGMLRSHREDVRWWKQVADGVQSYDLRAKGQMEYVIKLSFDRLPFDLKPCFLYLGVFPGDTAISVRTLLQLWVSEGFIPPSNGNISSEDIAAFYLQNLVDRSLVMVQKRSSNDQIKTIKIHDTLREFCKDRAKRENLFREIETIARAENMPTDDDRRLCINSGLSDYFRSKPAGRRVRSLLCFSIEKFIMPLDQITNSISKPFQLLRVLDIRSIKLERFPPFLYNLVLLKYIAIFCGVKTLTDKMSNLWNLQTLIIQTSAGTILEIKADIWKMAHLRHVETNASVILPRTREDSPKNANLQTLSAISPESCKREVFDRTPMLKKLGIRGKLALLLEDDLEFSSLSRLENLENLKLLNKNAEKIHVFPSASLFPSKLVKLTLLNTLLGWKHMSTLGKLEYLEVLKLKDNAFEGPVWKTEDGGFKRLKVLHIGKTDLSLWKTSSNHFPVLTCLYLRHCTGLDAIPRDLEGISSLQVIDLYCPNASLVSSARRFQVAKLESNKKFKLIVYPPEE